jgi:hypothetical protein
MLERAYIPTRLITRSGGSCHKSGSLASSHSVWPSSKLKGFVSTALPEITAKSGAIACRASSFCGTLSGLNALPPHRAFFFLTNRRPAIPDHPRDSRHHPSTPDSGHHRVTDHPTKLLCHCLYINYCINYDLIHEIHANTEQSDWPASHLRFFLPLQLSCCS